MFNFFIMQLLLLIILFMIIFCQFSIKYNIRIGLSQAIQRSNLNMRVWKIVPFPMLSFCVCNIMASSWWPTVHSSSIYLIPVLSFSQTMMFQWYLLGYVDVCVYFSSWVIETFEIYSEDLGRLVYEDFATGCWIGAALAFEAVWFW